MKETWTRRDFSSLLLGGLTAGFLLPSLQASESTIPFKLGIITDEVSQDLEQAVDFVSQNGLHYAELRQIYGYNIMNAPAEELDRARQLLERHHILVSDIASPIFKYNLPEMPARPEEPTNAPPGEIPRVPAGEMDRASYGAFFTDKDSEALLRHSFDLARFFKTSKVRICGFLRVDEPEKAYPFVRDRIAKAVSLAAKNGIVLVLENEHEWNIATGRELGRILRDINSPYLRGNWDVCNGRQLGEVPYPDGYREVRGLFSHMHLRDIKKDPKTGELIAAPIGEGSVDFLGLFKALRQDKYDGTMAIETGDWPDGGPVERTRKTLAGLLKIIKESA
jgi:L-ribulose-5-phosphate 3-epimerase